MRTIVVGLRLTDIEHQALLKVLEKENRRRARARPDKLNPKGLSPWSVADLLREWIAQAGRARRWDDKVV